MDIALIVVVVLAVAGLAVYLTIRHHQSNKTPFAPPGPNDVQPPDQSQ